jgi:hypothetical protein
MGRIIIEYNPPLSSVVQKIIRNEVTPSMVSNDETSCQYCIDMVAECLEEIIEQKLEEINVTDDLELINELRKEEVHYIEF